MTSDELSTRLDELGRQVERLTDEVARLRRAESYRLNVDRLGYSIDEAARLAGVGVHEFRELVRAGKVPSFAVGARNGRRVVPLSAVARFVDEAANSRSEV